MSLSNLWTRWFRKESPFEPILPNPYIVGNPIQTEEMFYGREDDFAYARQLLETEQGIIIVFKGERRCGKTSILHQIRNGRLGDAFLPVMIEMQFMSPMARNDREFYITMARMTCNALGRDDLRVEGYDFEGHPVRAFEELIDDVQRIYEGKKLVFMIDEYTMLEEKVSGGVLSGDVILFLASLLERKGCSFIFTGSERLEDLTGDHWKVMIAKANYKNISFLSRRDTFRLIREPVEGRVYYARGVLEAILRLSAGHPYYTQVLCQNMVDRLNDEEKNRADREDLERVVEDEVEHAKPQMLYAWDDDFSSDEKVCLSLLGDVLRNEGDRASPRQIVRAVEVRGYPLDLPEDRVSVVLEGLFGRQVVDKRRGSYSFRMDLWRRWVARAHSIWQVLNEVGLVSGEPIEVTAPAPSRRKRAFFIPAVAALVAIVVVSAVYLFQRPGTEEGGEKTGPIVEEGMMKVTTDPPGAAIYLDGDTLSRGTTPYVITGLSPGMHRVVAGKEGYVSSEDSAKVVSDIMVVKHLALVQKRGIVSVRSDPPGAEVYVDGESEGPTPREIELPAESHLFRLKRAGYAEETREVEVIADSTIEMPVVVLQREFGGVVIRSSPSGAEVYVDKEKGSRGRTPLTLAELPPGSYMFRLQKERYEETSQRFVVVANRMDTLDVGELARVLGRLAVSSMPSGAQVYVEGGEKKRAGETPWLIPDLSPGSYRVRVEHEGYEPVERPVEVRAGENPELTVTLTRQYGDLELVVRPWGRVWIDGEEKGTSPIGIQKLGVGEHTVRLTHPEYEDTTMTVVIPRKGETVKETIRLTKKKQ